MPSLLEEIADALARDVLKASQELKDDDLVNEISKVIGTSSPTTQEAFLTAVRIRMAEARARKALAEKLGKRSWDGAAAAPAPVRDEAVAARRPAPVQAPAVEQGPARVQAVVPPPNARPSALAPQAAPAAPVDVVPVAAAPMAEATRPEPTLAAAAQDVPMSPRTQVRRVMTRPAVDQPEAIVPPAAPDRTVAGVPTLGPSLPISGQATGLPDSGSPRVMPQGPATLGAPAVTRTVPVSELGPTIKRADQAVRPEPHVYEAPVEPRQGASGLSEAPVHSFAPAPSPARMEELGSPQVSGRATSVAEPVPVALAAPPDAPASVVSTAPDTTKTPVAELPEPSPPPVQHPPGSLAEALARAAAMPKTKGAAAEPKRPIVNPYADIEMPDGDWG